MTEEIEHKSGDLYAIHGGKYDGYVLHAKELDPGTTDPTEKRIRNLYYGGKSNKTSENKEGFMTKLAKLFGLS